MTLDVYSGLFDDDLDGVAARLDAQATTVSAHGGAEAQRREGALVALPTADR